MKHREPTYKKFIIGHIERFDERLTAYSRSYRGELPKVADVIKRGLNEKAPKNMPGYMREDYALNVAGRTVDTMVRRAAYSRESMPTRWPPPEEKVPIDDPSRITSKIKRAARWFGADLVGVCEVNPVWIYSHIGEYSAGLSPNFNPGDPIDLDERYRYAVVMVIAMDYADCRRAPAVTPSVDIGYSMMGFIAASMAEFIRWLGYKAIPAGNDLALSVPLAVDAGLGEMGRNGLLITEQFGPRVRICKVFTELPLVPDDPVDLGVQHFCERCKLCAKTCPSRALSEGERADQPCDESNNSGLLKWQVNAAKCLNWWYKNGAAGCGNCIRSCPWNKPPGVLHKIVRGVTRRTSLFDRLFIKGDELMGYGRQVLGETPDEETYG